MAGRRAEILDAALAIADERGLDAVTMRAVAQWVGVTPMALYPHVRDKAGLLDGMVDRLLGGLPLPDPGQDWQDRLRGTATAMRRLAARHPGAIGLLFVRPAVTPDATRLVDALYQALLDAGVPAEQVPRVERLVSTAVLGFVVSEVSGRFAPDNDVRRARRGQLPEGDLTGHHAIARWLERPVDWTAEFEADLADLAALLEVIVARHRKAGG